MEDKEYNVKVEVELDSAEKEYDIGWNLLIVAIITLIAFYAIIELICKTAKEIFG